MGHVRDRTQPKHRSGQADTLFWAVPDRSGGFLSLSPPPSLSFGETEQDHKLIAELEDRSCLQKAFHETQLRPAGAGQMMATVSAEVAAGSQTDASLPRNTAT